MRKLHTVKNIKPVLKHYNKYNGAQVAESAKYKWRESTQNMSDLLGEF